MASLAIVGDVVQAQPFDNAGTTQIQVTLNTILVDLVGARSQKTTVTVFINTTDTGTQVNTKIQAAVSAQATALGYSIAANATLIPQYARV